MKGSWICLTDRLDGSTTLFERVVASAPRLGNNAGVFPFMLASCGKLEAEEMPQSGLPLLFV